MDEEVPECNRGLNYMFAGVIGGLANFLKEKEETNEYRVKSDKKTTVSSLEKNFAILKTSKRKKEYYYAFFE